MGTSSWLLLRLMRVVHPGLGFLEQLKDLGSGPVLGALCVCLPGVMALDEHFLGPVLAVG